MAIHSWVASSLVRHFPATWAQCPPPLTIEAALNEQFSLQVALRLDGERQRVRVEALAPAGWAVRVRRVGYVPVRHRNTPPETGALDAEALGLIPGYVPDPLFDEDSLLLPPGETHAFWITVRPGPSATPGKHTLQIRLAPEKEPMQAHQVPVELHDLVLQPRRGFNITHWFYNDSLIDWYKTDLFDARFWQILPAYLRNVVEHGQDTLYVPVFTPPLDGVKRPTQLLGVTRTGSERYAFDWSAVRRYIRLARDCGVTHWEWCHLFTQWGCEYAIRIYEGQGREEQLLWPPETPATSPIYRAFLAQFLPELARFLAEEQIAERSYFHVSDEPHGEKHLAQYAAARGLLRELAPWMRVMDALSSLEFAAQGLTDLPIPGIQVALDFVAKGIPSWCYYCVGPRGAYLNRLLDTPLAKIAMHGLLFYRWPFQGFLYWGYNYWQESRSRRLIDPFTEQCALFWERGWTYGDPFSVYPGPAGPIDSLRWEVIGESLQDYRLLQTLGVSRDDPALAAIKSFSEFPKTETWRRELRAQMWARAKG